MKKKIIHVDRPVDDTAFVQIVKDGYNSNRYNEMYRDSARSLSETEKQIINRFVKDGDLVLDVGCGNASLYGAYLINTKKCNYIGVDISENQIRRARENFPNNKFLVDDYLVTPVNPGLEIDAITFFYSFFHFPLHKIPVALKKTHILLKQGGHAIILMRKENEVIRSDDNWCGCNMVWCHAGTEFVSNEAHKVGFKVEIMDAAHDEDYVWVFLTKLR